MLTKSQQQAIIDIMEFMNDPIQNIHCLSGSPGTGKSFLITEAIIPMLISKGWNVIITATTNKAASILKGQTLCKAFGITLKADLNSGKQIYDTRNSRCISNSFIIVDEASMLEKTLWQLIVARAKRCKFLMVGDKYQLPAVKSGLDVFDSYPCSMLTEVVRQNSKKFIEQINKVKEGVINKIVTLPEKCPEIKFLTLKDKKEAVKLLTDFGQNDKVLCYTNANVNEYNKNIRKLKGKSEELGAGDNVLARNYAESVLGDSTYSDEELVIEEMSASYIWNIQGKYDTYPIEVKDVKFKGKRGSFKKFISYEKWDSMLKKLAYLKDWKAYFECKEKLVDIRSAEACTVHCSQGSTYDRVFIDLGDIMSCKQTSVKTRLLYVALSRAKKEAYIYG